MPLLSPSDTSFKPPTVPEKEQPRRVLLVVDDEEGPRQSLRIVFKDEYRVILAENGPRAIELARQHPVSAAVLDIRMTGMSGIELLKNLKQINPAIEVIMLTAFETLDTARQALRLGACDYLNKPFDVPTLRAAVANAMTRSALNEERHSTNRKLRELQSEIHDHRVAEEMSRTKGEIYASVLHDINSPLTVIAGFVEMINEKVAQPQPLEDQNLEEVRRQLSLVSRQVNKCVEICHRYLNFARSRGSETGTVGINQILSDLGELLRVHPTARNHQLHIRPLAEDAHAGINGTDLIQALLNLAVNAFQCCPTNHRVEIAGARVAGPLPLDTFANTTENRFVAADDFVNAGQLIALTVQDNGPGIPPESAVHLFEPFFSTKAPGQGTGLGLAIVQRLIRAAHGAIHVQSRCGAGTTFTVYLPLRG